MPARPNHPSGRPDDALIKRVKDAKRTPPDPQVVVERSLLLDPTERRRLGYGAFEEPDRRRSRLDARLRFLEAVGCLVPDCLKDLADEPLGQYDATNPWEPPRWHEVALDPLAAHDLGLKTSKGAIPGPSRSRLDWSGLVRLVRTGDLDATALATSLTDWLIRWFYDPHAGWLLEMALETLREWVEYGVPIADEKRRFHPGDDADAIIFAPLPIGPPEPVSFEAIGWDIGYESRGEAQERLRAEFERKLTGHLDQIEAAVSRAGLVAVPPKTADDHWQWLALWQVSETHRGRHRSILDWLRTDQGRHVTNNTLKQGIERAAAQAGIQLRPGARGRPRT